VFRDKDQCWNAPRERQGVIHELVGIGFRLQASAFSLRIYSESVSLFLSHSLRVCPGSFELRG
jgi:hypothetical protein